MTRASQMFTVDRLSTALVEIGAGPAPTLFEQLEVLYAQPDRHYHNRKHVEECLEALDQHMRLAERPAEVELAIWFHDAVYDSRKADNEERSAELAATVLTTLAVAHDSVRRIGSMILATKAHLASGPDAQLLLDIDLGILGQPPDVFAGYDESIRREYAWVPEDRYRAGRISVLRGFLDRPRIYATEPFRNLYENQARINLEARLSRLEMMSGD